MEWIRSWGSDKELPAPKRSKPLIVLWSPEAIADIASLRAYIAEGIRTRRIGSRFTSVITSSSFYQAIRRWGVLGACPARGNS